MKFRFVKLAGLALAGLVAASAGAQAGSISDFNDNSYSSYNNRNLDDYCDRNPYDDRCGGYDEPRHEKKHYHKKKRYSDGCRAYIRAAGKRNIVRAFARNSARFAWRREVRAVHGSQYANWNRARNAEIVCTHEGALKACVAKATPCKY